MEGIKEEKATFSGRGLTGGYSGLEMLIDIQRIKIVFNTMASLLNACIINTNRGEREDMINTWDLPPGGRIGIDSKRS